MDRDETSARFGLLSLVSTPIGNLEDITLRALAILREADCIAAEDTRRIRILTSHYGITTRTRSFHAHSNERVLDSFIESLENGAHIALVTDAGTPLVSDPGFALVQAAIARDIRVQAIPGASAVLSAIAVSGIPSDTFCFVGFLPRSGKKRKESINAIRTETRTLVFFESPHRLHKTLSDLRAELDPNRRVAVCRELTKLHEEVVRGTLEEVCGTYRDEPRGEITLVLSGANQPITDARLHEPASIDSHDLKAKIANLLRQGKHAKQIAAELSKTTGLPKRVVYREILQATK